MFALSTMACASLAWAANATKPAQNKTANVKHASSDHDVLTRWAPKELKGTISMVDPQQDLVVVRDSSGVPFDFRVQRSTHIVQGRQSVGLSQLAQNETVDVRFIPEARGDIARQIHVQR